MSRISVAFRRIWWALGTLPDGTVLYVPGGGDRMVSTLDGWSHATDVSLRPSRRRTVDTVCGLRRAKPLIVHTDNDQALVPIWPPPARFADLTRCDDCVAFTGKKRPDRMYQGLSIVDPDEAVSA